MKKISISKKICFIALIMLFCFSNQLIAQPLPLNDPTTNAEWIADNRIIAEAFAPVLAQAFDDSNDGNDGRYDIPLRINYDNDWNHANNWQNAPNMDGTALNPEAYYHVMWHDDYWIVAYNFYYPRDYANGNIGCGFGGAEHEGDMERVYVYIERPANSNYVVSDLLRGYVTTNHTERSFINCVADNQMIVSTNNSPGITNGAHPVAFGSAGSHAIYPCFVDAWYDEGTSSNWCRPDPDGVNTLNPVMVGQSTGPGDINQATGYYLIDLFDPSLGVWNQRNNPSTCELTTVENRKNQKLNGDDGNIPGPPWSGDSFDPTVFLGRYEKDSQIDCSGEDDVFGEPFDCDCKVPPANCSAMTFVTEEYSFSGLRCEGYTFPTMTELPGYQVKAEILADGVYNPDNDYVSWSIISTGGNYSCTGCDQGLAQVTLIPEEDGFCSDDFSLAVSATVISIECGSTVLTQVFGIDIDPEDFGEDQLAGTSLLQNQVYNFGDSELPYDPQQITRTYNRIEHDITVENDGEIWFNRIDRIAFTDNTSNPSNATHSSYTAYIGGCISSPQVTVGMNGNILIGQRENGDNEAHVFVEDGASIIIQEGGKVEVDEDSRLVIRNGGLLKVEYGGTLRDLLSGQIIIEEGGKLIIEDGANIDLWWSNATILIKGELEINGQFKFVGSGYFQFDETHVLTLNSDFHLKGQGGKFIQLNPGTNLNIGNRHLDLEEGIVKYGDDASIDIGAGGSVRAERVIFSSNAPAIGNTAINANGASELDFFICEFEDLFLGIITNGGQSNQTFRNYFCEYRNCGVGIGVQNQSEFICQNTSFYGGPNSSIALQAIDVDYIGMSSGTIQDYDTPGAVLGALTLQNVSDASITGIHFFNNEIGVRLEDVDSYRMYSGDIKNSMQYGIYVPALPGSSLANRSKIFMYSGATLENNAIGIQVDKGAQLGPKSYAGSVLMDCAKLINNDVGIQGEDVFLDIDAFFHCQCTDPDLAKPNTFIKSSIPQNYQEFFNICYRDLEGIVTNVPARGNYWTSAMVQGSDYILRNPDNSGNCTGNNFINLDYSSPVPDQPTSCSTSGPDKPKEENIPRSGNQAGITATAEELMVFPNPTEGWLEISMGAENFEVQIFNTLGINVYRNNRLSNYQLDVSDWPKGVYWLKVIKAGTDREWVRKLLVQ